VRDAAIGAEWLDAWRAKRGDEIERLSRERDQMLGRMAGAVSVGGQADAAERLKEELERGNYKSAKYQMMLNERARRAERERDEALKHVADLEYDLVNWKRLVELAEDQNCESCGCSIEVPDGSGFVAWICAECWGRIIRERDAEIERLTRERDESQRKADRVTQELAELTFIGS